MIWFLDGYTCKYREKLLYICAEIKYFSTTEVRFSVEMDDFMSFMYFWIEMMDKILILEKNYRTEKFFV